MGISGIGDLQRMRAKFREASTDLRARLLKAAAAEAQTQVALGFREQRDPYGTAWAPLAYRQGRILRDTARMANSFSARPTETGFTVGTNVTYAPVHQFGGRVRARKDGKPSRGKVGRIPARPMVPRGGQLSPLWAAAIRAAVEAAFRNFWK